MSVTVHVPTPLRSYTGGAAAVDAGGATLAEVLSDLDRRFPGMRFRMIDEQDGIRTHIKLFVGAKLERSLGRALRAGDDVHIVCALSGG